MSEKRRPPRKKGKGNTGITANHITVWTMNHEPLPDEIHSEIETFLALLIKSHGTRILVSMVKV